MVYAADGRFYVRVADITAAAVHERTLSLLAAFSSRSYLEGMRILLEDASADVNLIVDHHAALSVAADCGRVEAMKLLVSHGADINIESGTPLHSACGAGNMPAVRYLIETGAALDAVCVRWMDETHNDSPVMTSAVRLAAQFGRLDLLQFLHQKGAQLISTSGPYHTTALHSAAIRDTSVACSRWLLI